MFKISKKGLLIGIILLLIIVSGCSTTKEVEEVNKESSQESNRKVELTTLDELYSLKLPFIPSDVSIEEYIDPDQTVENLLNLVVETISEGKSTYVKSISKEDVMEDIDKYFSYLKGGYAGYLANGGDEAFNKAKAAIIDNIYDGIDSIKLSKLFEVEMKFVNDAHFTIGGLNTMEKAKKWYYVEKLQMGEDENGYYNLNTGEYIKNQSELEPFLKPSLNSDGMLCFILVAFEEDLEKVPKEIIYSDNSKLYISFSQVRSMYHRDIEPTFSDNNIPYLSMKSCYMSNEKEFVDFVLKAAEKMSEAPIAILDLRGNFGGDGITSNKWIQAYSGEEPQNSATFVTIISEKSFIDNTYGQTWEEYTEFSKDEIYDDNHTINRASSKVIEKNNKLIVLVDSNTGSAAESIVDNLHHLDNTIFIGMPTFGCLNSSLLFIGRLQNSQIRFGFGNYWNIFNEEYFNEYKGFKPDIWIPYINLDELIEFLIKS